MDVELSTAEKIKSNTYIVGMALFSIAAIFNFVTFLGVLISGLVKQSIGIYLLFLVTADTLFYLTEILYNDFYNELIDVDIFEESGSPVMVCQIIYFLQEFAWYFRWMILSSLIIDRSLLIRGVGKARLRVVALVLCLVWMAVCAGFAGYWIWWVDDTLIPGEYTPKACKFTLPATDTDPIYYHAIVHVLFPDVGGVVTVLVASIVVLVTLRGKGGEQLEEDDFRLCKVVAALGLLNVLFILPFLVVNCLLLYVHYLWDVYDFSATVWANLTYTAPLSRKIRSFGFGTFFVLLFAKPFRVFCCRD